MTATAGSTHGVLFDTIPGTLDDWQPLDGTSSVVFGKHKVCNDGWSKRGAFGVFDLVMRCCLFSRGFAVGKCLPRMTGV